LIDVTILRAGTLYPCAAGRNVPSRFLCFSMLRRLTDSFRDHPNAWLFAAGLALVLLPGLHRLAVAYAYRILFGSTSWIFEFLRAEYQFVGREAHETALRAGVIAGALVAGFARWRANRSEIRFRD
jgi:hypothetical protein